MLAIIEGQFTMDFCFYFLFFYRSVNQNGENITKLYIDWLIDKKQKTKAKISYKPTIKFNDDRYKFGSQKT